jgi:hypothetical protein
MEATRATGGHLVRYGTAADQHYLIGEFLNTYDQLVFNASIVAHMPAALAIFITQRANNKPYFIDPQTHAFQHDIEYLQSNSERNEGKIKRSVSKLINYYGDPIKAKLLVEEKSILPSDFSDPSLVREFCQRVMGYQFLVIDDEASQSDVSPYYEFLKEEKGLSINTFGPDMIIAPYFYMEGSTFKEWVRTNIFCAEESKKIASLLNKPLGIQIAISQDVLFIPDYIDQIKRYCEIQPEKILLWIDKFDEQTASIEHLKKYVELLKIFQGKGIPIVNLYGGFFSVLLKRRGLLSGVTHSLEYGEQRSVVPVGGGIPVAKFYLPELHFRMQSRDAYRAVKGLGGLTNVSDFHKKVCGCKQCEAVITTDPNIDFYNKYGQTRVIKGRQYPTPETKNNCVRHYMWVKEKEYNSKETPEEAIKRLEDTRKQLEKHVGLENTIHCQNWADAIKLI